MVGNFKKVFDTYSDIVGLNPVSGGRNSAFAVFEGTTGVQSLALFRANGKWRKGLRHVGFKISNEVDLNESLRRLSGIGLRIESEFDHPARRGVFLRDMDGIRLQFYVERNSGMNALGACDSETALYLV